LISTKPIKGYMMGSLRCILWPLCFLQCLLSFAYFAIGLYCALGEEKESDDCSRYQGLFWFSQGLNFSVFVLNAVFCCIIILLSSKKGVTYYPPWRHLYYALKDRNRWLSELKLWFLTAVVIYAVWYSNNHVITWILRGVITISILVTSMTTSYLAAKNISPGEVRREIEINKEIRNYGDDEIDDNMAIPILSDQLEITEDLNHLVLLCTACSFHNGSMLLYNTVAMALKINIHASTLSLLLAFGAISYRWLQTNFYFIKQSTPARNPLLPLSTKCA